MEQEYQRILVGIDGSQQAQEAFEKAVEVAKRNHSALFVANVLDQKAYSFIGFAPISETVVETEIDQSKSLIDAAKAYAQKAGVTEVEGILAYGSAKEAMAHQLPNKYQIDLIMVGQSGLNAVERFMLGSVSSYIIREAPCDVLVVRPTHQEKANS
ncbi:universal stress protein [Enterococcus sp. HY326]|uniref:universal stress protein n=1 Tax=Enterococcus sp. HY326 TaxID=2971265 RepID=UPI00223F33E4|nr:universal stress protein [Enterococcus sp. HY326]